LIKDSDADMFIDNFRRKHEMNPSFFYDYEADNEGKLKRVFWADDICRKNYSLFEDVISFDTTYRTNKYLMIFAPFTGINNHRQSPNFFNIVSNHFLCVYVILCVYGVFKG
jgi:hypothetical protein